MSHYRKKCESDSCGATLVVNGSPAVNLSASFSFSFSNFHKSCQTKLIAWVVVSAGAAVAEVDVVAAVTKVVVAAAVAVAKVVVAAVATPNTIPNSLASL